MATRDELRLAARQHAECGLRCSAKWVAELLVSIARDGQADAEMLTQEEDDEEQDRVLLAKAYFDTNEFQRAAHVLEGVRSSRGCFLRWYSLFLAGEKRKEEETLEEVNAGAAPASVPSTKPRVINQQLAQLEAELKPLAEAGKLDGYGSYAYAMVLRELQRPKETTVALAQALRSVPCLWAAWIELASLNADYESLSAVVQLPQHWMLAFFRAHAALEAQKNSEAVEAYNELLRFFPRSGYVKSQLALAQYNLREFDAAQQGFEELRELEPYRLEYAYAHLPEPSRLPELIARPTPALALP